MPVRILCLGNELVSDDGIGIRVGRVLRALDLPEGVQIEMRPHAGIDMLDSMQAGEDLVLIDAMVTGAPPGTCRTLLIDDLEALAHRPLCCHGLGVAEVVAAARHLKPTTVPRSIRLIGIEAQVLDRFGTALSPALQEALPHAVALTLRCIGADQALERAGWREAQRCKAWEPDALETGE